MSKICFDKNLMFQETNVKHSDKTNKDYYSVVMLDQGSGEFIKIPTTETIAKSLTMGETYKVSVRAEGFFIQEHNISGYRLFAYSASKA